MDNSANDRREKLTEDIRDWLKHGPTLAKVREYLGGEALSDFKIANWTKREIPRTLVEGAALYHCVHDFDEKAAERTGLVADHFWQVFVVDKEPKKGLHDCLTIRYWENVEWYGKRGEQPYLMPRTWFSGHFPVDENDEDHKIRDIVEGKLLSMLKPDDDGDGWEWIIHKPQDNKGGAVKLRWEVKKDGRPDPTPDSATKDYGYSVKLMGTIHSETRELETVGGISVIPVKAVSIVAVLPNSIIAPDSGNFFHSPNQQCHGFPPEDDPIKTLEPLLKKPLLEKPQNRQRRLAGWSLNPGTVQKNVALSAIPFPQKIKDHLKWAGVLKDGTAGEDYGEDYKDHSVFRVYIAAPEALLNCCLFFRLRSAEPDVPSPSSDNSGA